MSNTVELQLENEAAPLKFGQRLARAFFVDPDFKLDADSAELGAPIVGGVIHLTGDLGAGKTTLTRGIMRGFGFTGAVKSPTYTLVEPYEFLHCKIYHFDLYRLGDPEEVAYLGIDDYFKPENLCIVEWADRGKGLIPNADLVLNLSGTGTARTVSCQILSEKGDSVAKRLWG
ncbi:MAG: tRNA (adenosine(37)-N6)-threonylcarbamoyltransferase complex ATPase subunit type 1 TsaE [Proteobacteria bacterium]|nr:tRNA (adenosine(37)-N6)-threonylcarbamoyltransferase complex ATPase subunit type 1 TsaE [Pseudomonadota bacterium]MDA0927744.1 tRNA (adenosine(37)-N6)-threonylcarbamoyltransferase complex ATPase subunit type 1 TsaE [Pseudomonadota bacterium]